jgi:hypothetical protein
MDDQIPMFSELPKTDEPKKKSRESTAYRTFFWS